LNSFSLIEELNNVARVAHNMNQHRQRCFCCFSSAGSAVGKINRIATAQRRRKRMNENVDVWKTKQIVIEIQMRS